MRVFQVLTLLSAGAAATAWAVRDGRAAPPLSPVHSAFGDTSSACSDDMVRVGGKFCIDRFESSLVDDATEQPLSPYYPPIASLLRSVYDEWTQRLLDGTAGVDVPLPV